MNKKLQLNIQKVVFWVTLLLLGFVVGYFFERNIASNISKVAKPTNTPTIGIIVDVFPTLPPTPTPKPKIIVKATIDPDPVILCNVSKECGGGTKQLKKSTCNQSTCCQIGKSWIFYESVSKCKQDQGPVSNKPIDSYTPYPKTSYISCTLFYPTTGVEQTYNYSYTSDQACLDAQLKLNADAQNFLDSLKTTATTSPTTAPQNNPQQNSQCKSTASQWYTQQQQQIMAKYGGGSSAGPAMIQIANQQYQSMVADCNRQYPI